MVAGQLTSGEAPDVTTLTVEQGQVLTPHEHAVLNVDCLLDAGLAVFLSEGGGVTYDNRVASHAQLDHAIEACDQQLIDMGYVLIGDPFKADQP